MRQQITAPTTARLPTVWSLTQRVLALAPKPRNDLTLFSSHRRLRPKHRWARGIQYPSAKLPVASKLFFGTVPYVGSVYVRMGMKLHPQDFVWWFLLYQILEIASRVLSLVIVALPLGLYTFLLLGWLWLSRAYISRVSIGGAVVRERLRFRKLIRFAACPIMDSVIDRATSYKVCCFFTCLETVCFLALGNAVSGVGGEEELSSDLARPIFTVS